MRYENITLELAPGFVLLRRTSVGCMIAMHNCTNYEVGELVGVASKLLVPLKINEEMLYLAHETDLYSLRG